MLLKDALRKYGESHLSTIGYGDERLKQLKRILGKYFGRQMHTISQKDLTDALSSWQGATRNRYRSALTHFWKWGRSESLTKLRPTLMPGKEAPRDKYLSLEQLRTLYKTADDRGDWEGFCKLLILTGQRNSDIMKFGPGIIMGDEVHLPTSKNGTSHIVHLNHRARAIVEAGYPWLGKTTYADMKKRWFDDADIPLSFQLRDVRRSFATHMVENGADENVVDRILNHQAAATSAGVKRTYNRAGRLKERRKVMYDWEDMLLGSHKVKVSSPDDWNKLATHQAPLSANFGLKK